LPNWLSQPLCLCLAALGAVVAGLVLCSRCVQRSRPDELLIVVGRRGGSGGGRGFSVVRGGVAFVWPIREKAYRMPVGLFAVDVSTPTYPTKHGVPVALRCGAWARVAVDDEVRLGLAIEMLLGKTAAERAAIVRNVVLGRVRAACGSMSIEEIHAHPDGVRDSVTPLVAADLAVVGLDLVGLSVDEVIDPSGYLLSVARVSAAEAERDAAVGEAGAEGAAVAAAARSRREAEVSRIEAERAIIRARHDGDMEKHELAGRVEGARAVRDSSYDLADAKARQDIARERVGIDLVEREERIRLEELEIQRKERELEHRVRQPTAAERQRVESLADAEAYRIRAKAGARADTRRLDGAAEAEAIVQRGAAEAETIRLRGLAEADALRARAQAEADSLRIRAQALEECGAALVLQAVLDRLPDLVAALRSPGSHPDRPGLGSAEDREAAPELAGSLALLPGLASGVETPQEVPRELAPAGDGEAGRRVDGDPRAAGTGAEKVGGLGRHGPLQDQGSPIPIGVDRQVDNHHGVAPGAGAGA